MTAVEVIAAPGAADWNAVERLAAADRRVRLADGLGGARGRWIATLDAGDLMHPRRLRDLVALAEADACDIAADTMLVFRDHPRVAGASLPGFARSKRVVASDRVILANVRPLIRTALLHGDARAGPGAVQRLLAAGAVFRLYPQLTYFHRLQAGAAPAPPRSVTVISRQRLLGRANGSSAYLLSLCEALHDAGMTLHLVSPTPATFGRWPAVRMGPEMAVFSSIAMRGAWRVGGWLVARDPRILLRAIVTLATRRFGGRDTPAAYAVALPVSRADQLFVARHARGQPAAVIADYAFLTELIAYALSPAALGVVVMHDLFSSRAAQFTQVGGDDSTAAIGEDAEMALLALADCVVAIQPAEAAIVARRLPATRVLTAPMAVRPVAAPQPGIGGVLFVGSGAAPNVDGLAWFLAEIWPAVRAAVPGTVLTVVGGVGREVAATPGVHIAGRVDDLAPTYRDAAVVISPLRVGSGLKIKLVEALGHGKAVVATSVTLQGIEAATRSAVIVADDPAPFAAGIVALLQDPALRARHAAAALDVAHRHFSAAACYGEIVALISDTNGIGD